MLNCIISYFLTIFTALCTWVKIDVMSTIEKKLEEVGELNSLFDPTGPPPEAAPAPRPALSLSGELQRSPGQLPPPYIGGLWGEQRSNSSP